MIFHQFWWHFQWVKCHQFLWFFLEIFVDLLNWWHFRHTKTHQFLQITKIFTKIGEKFAENSKENSNHQHFHKKLWKFWHIWDHIDFLQNCHQFWWFPWIFANFCDKKPKIERNYCHQNWWHFLHSKTHQFLQITRIFTKIGDKKNPKSEGIIVTIIGDIFVT